MGRHQQWVEIREGRLSVDLVRDGVVFDPSDPALGWILLHNGPPGSPYHFGFYLWPDWYSTADTQSLSIPLWMFALPWAILTAVFWRWDALARRRARLNLCPACNYDRRGLPAASVCPECGAAPAAPAQAST
jgi:hypothetical protein